MKLRELVDEKEKAVSDRLGIVTGMSHELRDAEIRVNGTVHSDVHIKVAEVLRIVPSDLESVTFKLDSGVIGWRKLAEEDFGENGVDGDEADPAGEAAESLEGHPT